MKHMYIILGIVVGIVLGLFYISKKRNLKEGLVASEQEANALGANINNYANSQLTAAGVNPTDNTAEIGSVFNQMAALIENEKKEIDKNSYDAPVVQDPAEPKFHLDTTPEACPGKTFLIGTHFSDGFCKTNYYNPETLNAQCNRLTPDNCKATSCCILLEGDKCMPGTEKGPDYIPDQDYTYYIYKYKKYEKK